MDKRYPSTESIDSKRKSSFFLKHQEDLEMLIPDDDPIHLKKKEIMQTYCFMETCHLKSALLLDFFQPFLKTIKHKKEPMHEKMQILSIIYSILEIKLLIKSIKLNQPFQHDFFKEYLIYSFKILNKKFNSIQSIVLKNKIFLYIRNMDEDRFSTFICDHKSLFKRRLLF